MKMRWRKQLPGLMDRTNFGRLMEFRLLTVWDIPQAHGNILFWFDGVITSADFWSPQQQSIFPTNLPPIQYKIRFIKGRGTALGYCLSNLLWQFLIWDPWFDFRFCKIIMSWWATHWVYNLQIFIIQDIYNLYNASNPRAHLTRTWRTPLFRTGWRERAF